ncbi:CmlA/FloR family chloramphenicol efflux MFS transporter [Rhizobium lusitanum]|uniref:Bcr/CflA family efflux transporter n=1 Tax=Rhizobium lusitanum TaxID=293958 RepID=A0A7X0ME93_9HYPH|nr:CmlA/FloR family chloramphenicol efflux MFS transporter [Rhizobium lusitanum]MBB6487236.1 DHA1 family florfenicol/chloramphenicol resistance protein-like MFS transporter [Rhizobium lusitanum]
MTYTRPSWAYSLPAALLLMAPFDIIASLAMDIYLPVVPSMPGILNTSASVIQLTLSGYMIVLGAGQIIFGPISDRVGRRPVLILGAILFAAASVGAACASTAGIFVLCRLLQASGASAVLVATFATVRDVYADREEGAVIYSAFGAILSFVPALGPIAGAVIADRFGWRAIFVLLALLALAATINATARWHETRPFASANARRSISPIFASFAFWVYTLAFSAVMGTFFVFFSTAPRVLIGHAGYSELGFSLAFATVAGVMIATTRFARIFVGTWSIAGCVTRGMLLLLCGAAFLAFGQIFGSPSFASFLLPVWIMAVGIVFAASVTANGALAKFGDMAGSAVAFYFCIQSVIVSIVGTLSVTILDGDSAWPLVTYSTTMAVLVLIAQILLKRHEPTAR